VRDPEAEATLGVIYRDEDTVLREAASVTLHVPRLPKTRHYVGEREFRLMKPTT
jgi:phosphoglycerate dehydrogenase-like enzyme